MNNANFETKTALYINGKRVTEYIYDYAKICNNIALMISGTTLDVYDTNLGEYVYSLEGIKDAKFGCNCIIVTNTFGKMAAFTLDGYCILPFLYKSIYTEDNYFITKSKNDYITLTKYENGLLRTVISGGEEFIEFRIYKDIIITYKKNMGKKLCGAYSHSGIEIVPPLYQSLTARPDGILVMTEDYKKGIYSYSGKEIVPAKFDSIKRYNNCYIVCYIDKQTNYYGLYSIDGKKIVVPRYTSYEITSPFIKLHKDWKECLYSLITGKRLLPLKYFWSEVFHNIIYAQDLEGNYTIHSAENGKLVVNDVFKSVDIHLPYVLLLKKESNKSYYYLVKAGILLDAQKYEVMFMQNNNTVYVRENDGKNMTGNWIPYPVSE